MAKKTQEVAVAKFPEVGTFKDAKELKKVYKKLSNEELLEWHQLEGLTYDPCTDPMIDRMRRCMAILYHHFPKDAPKAKEKSKYADYTLENLIELAATNNVPVDVCDDARILRMRTIMMLKAHKVIE